MTSHSSTCLAVLAALACFSGTTSADVIYSSEDWEDESVGALPTTANGTDYVNTADNTARIRVAAHIDDGDAGTTDPAGQHGLVQGNINKHMTQTNPMTLATDGITFTDTAKLRWRKGAGSNGMNSSVYVDDVVITGIGGSGTPPDPEITSITKSGSTVTVQFTGTDGETYSLNKSTVLDFATPDIKDTVTLSGTTTGMLEDTSVTEDTAFYRVEQQ